MKLFGTLNYRIITENIFLNINDRLLSKLNFDTFSKELEKERTFYFLILRFLVDNSDLNSDFVFDNLLKYNKILVDFKVLKTNTLFNLNILLKEL